MNEIVWEVWLLVFDDDGGDLLCMELEQWGGRRRFNDWVDI